MKLANYHIHFKRFHVEAFFWMAALIALAIDNPYSSKPHYSLCVFKMLGFDHCPGCGLGHSVSCALKGDITNSFHYHPLGIIAIIILLHRIYNLFKKYPLIQHTDTNN